jgi:hypothetical protein
LEDGERFARASGHKQQHAVNALGELPQCLADGDVLIRPHGFAGDLVQVVAGNECSLPARPIDRYAHSCKQFVGRRRDAQRFEVAGVVVGQEPIIAVRGKREPKGQAARITRGLLHAIRRTLGFSLGLEDGQGHALITQQIVGDDRLRFVVHRIASEIYAAMRDAQLLLPRPADRRQAGLDQFSAGQPFVTCH